MPASLGSVQTDGFLTSTSWGYRLVGRLEYNNAFLSGNVSPRLAWAHDVRGVGPTFNEGVKSVSVGAAWDYQRQWVVDLQYTAYMGGRTYCGTDVPPAGQVVPPGQSARLLFGRQPAQGPRLLLAQRELLVLMANRGSLAGAPVPAPKKHNRRKPNMFAISKKATALLAVGAAFAIPAAAEMSAADIAKLGTTLTPVGAEKAGNAAGTIPAWDGGITKPVAGFKVGGHYPDPYAADKPLFTIDGKNADQLQGPALRRPDGDAEEVPDLQDGRVPDAPQRLVPAVPSTTRPRIAPPRPSSLPAATASSAARAAFRSRSRRTATRPSGIRRCAIAATRSPCTTRRPRSRAPATTRW